MCWFDILKCVTNLGEMTRHYGNTTMSRRDGLDHLIFTRTMTRVFTCSLSDNVDFFQNARTILPQNHFLYQIHVLQYSIFTSKVYHNSITHGT
jgi:hypothetical protein